MCIRDSHNSFTQTPEGEDVLVYHARNYTEIEGDPLYDPNRHTRLKLVSWREEVLLQPATNLSLIHI